MKINEAQESIKNLTLEEKIELLKTLSVVPEIKEKIKELEKKLNIQILD